MKALVAGAGGFIGGHLVARLLESGADVTAVDRVAPETWWQRHDTDSRQRDLREPSACMEVVKGCDQVYDLACDMGGIGFISAHPVDCMLSVVIAANLLRAAERGGVSRFFFSSSACVYPLARQARPDAAPLAESDVSPFDPEGGYGWEKLFTEQLVAAYEREGRIEGRIGRYHNVYGPRGPWNDGREKAPAAICRKVAEAQLEGNRVVEVWGDGRQTRSFTWIGDCVEGTVRLMESDVAEPCNIGSSELVTIDDLVDVVAGIAGVELERRHVDGAPQGVRGRNSDNTFVRSRLGWEPGTALREGLERTYPWIHRQVSAHRLGG